MRDRPKFALKCNFRGGEILKSTKTALVIVGLMLLASLGGIAARPPTKSAGTAPRYVLEDVVPKQFGDWKELPQAGAGVVNPQTQQLLDKLYSQILTRTYQNAAGYQIMLSLAYGDEQRGDLQAHKPEVCYPAQGFKLNSNVAANLATPFGTIPARQLSTVLGARNEPVTYWFTAGDKAITNKLELRMVEIKMGLTGQVPDGLLFRVSSIDAMTANALVQQQAFVVDLLQAVPEADRLRLSGLGKATGGS